MHPLPDAGCTQGPAVRAYDKDKVFNCSYSTRFRPIVKPGFKLRMLMQARAADEAGIQFRMLNASKGPAVRGPRAQMDRALYKKAMQRLVGEQPNLAVHDGAVTDLTLELSNGQTSVSGVTLASGLPARQAVVSANESVRRHAHP